MKLYELTYLISHEFSEEQAKEFSQKICSLVQEEKGVLDAVNPLMRKRQNEFYVTTLNFRCDPENLEALRKKLSMEKQISRYMLLNKPRISSKLKKERIKPIKPIIETKEKKVELKNIAKKLEEILE